MIQFDWERTLPLFLKRDIEALLQAEQQSPLPLNWDCLYNEVQGSINSALYGREISPEQAQALRDKYL